MQLAQPHHLVQLRLDFRQRFDVVRLQIIAITAADVASPQNVQPSMGNRLRCPGKLQWPWLHAATFPMEKGVVVSGAAIRRR